MPLRELGQVLPKSPHAGNETSATRGDRYHSGRNAPPDSISADLRALRISPDRFAVTTIRRRTCQRSASADFLYRLFPVHVNLFAVAEAFAVVDEKDAREDQPAAPARFEFGQRKHLRPFAARVLKQDFS